MSEETKEHIVLVYKEAAELAQTYTRDDVLLFSESSKDELQEAYANATNYTNKYLVAQKDLQFILVTLNIAKGNLDPVTPRGQLDLRVITDMVEKVKSLLEVYKSINETQKHILTYYEKNNLIF